VVYVLEGDVARVLPRVHRDAGGASLHAHVGRCNDRRDYTAACVAHGRDFVDVDRKLDHDRAWCCAGYLTHQAQGTKHSTKHRTRHSAPSTRHGYASSVFTLSAIS